MRYFHLLIYLSSLILLSACQEKATHSGVANPMPMQNAKAAYPGKPTAPVRINYQLSKTIQPGLPVVVSISITPLVDAQQLSLHYTMEGALTSGDPQPQFNFGPTTANTTLQQDITVIPQAEGSYRIIVSVSIDNPQGHTGSRSMSIPIVVGNPSPTTLKPQGTMDKDAHGKPIIVTPAKEDIIKH